MPNRWGEGRWSRMVSAVVLPALVATCVGATAVPAQSGGEAAQEAVSSGQPTATETRAIPWRLRWGPDRPDLLRYNRVEGLSVGARAGIRPEVFGRALSVTMTARIGAVDPAPSLRADLERASLGRTLSLAFYDELAATEETARHFGPLNSLTSALAGRDDGDYYRRRGVSLAWEPPPTEHPTYRVTVHAEHHGAVEAETRASLVRLWRDETWGFRPNVTAGEGWEHALSVAWSPSWGQDRREARGGLRTFAAASLGDHAHVRAGLLGRWVLPLPGEFQLALSAGGGAASSGVPPQRAFAVGGPSTLRGYPPRTRVGPCHGRARVELERTFTFGGAVAFSDGAWAGPCGAWSDARPLRSVGVGVSLVDGFLRVEVARALDGARDARLELYVAPRTIGH